MNDENKKIKINWFDNGCAEIKCICGAIMEISDNIDEFDDNKCDICSRQYTLIQDVKLMDDLKSPKRMCE